MINTQVPATKIRPRLTLEAMYLDGTEQRAKVVADWIANNRGEQLERPIIVRAAPREFVVQVETLAMPDFTIHPNRWVVRGTDQFMVLTPEMFQQTYEVV